MSCFAGLSGIDIAFGVALAPFVVLLYVAVISFTAALWSDWKKGKL